MKWNPNYENVNPRWWSPEEPYPHQKTRKDREEEDEGRMRLYDEQRDQEAMRQIEEQEK